MYQELRRIAIDLKNVALGLLALVLLYQLSIYALGKLLNFCFGVYCLFCLCSQLCLFCLFNMPAGVYHSVEAMVFVVTYARLTERETEDAMRVLRKLVISV